MDRQKLAELRERRAAAYNAMQDVLARSTESMSAEDQTAYDAAERDFDTHDAVIRRVEAQAERDRSMSAVTQERADDPERSAAHESETRAERFERALDMAQRSPANRASFMRGDEYREAFREVVLRGVGDVPEYRAALNLGVDAEGGYTAPVEFVRELFREAAEFSVLRGLSTNLQTTHGRELQFPELATKGQAGWTNKEVLTDGEADAFKSEPTFGAPKTLHAHPAQREVVTSKDLLQDSAFDVEALVRELIAESFIELADESYMNGDGTGEPEGIVPGLATSMIVTGAVSATPVLTVDDLIDVQHKPKRRYAQNARWILSDDALKAARKLEDGNGQKIWQPGLTEGEPGRLLGKPYDIDPHIASPAVSTVSILYGDFKGYWTRDVLAVSIQRLVELYARRRQVGFLADMRTDGKLVRPERVAAFKHGAAS